MSPNRLSRLAFQGAMWLAYPVLLFCGLRWGSPRAVALLLLALLVLRRRSDARQLMGSLATVDRVVLAALAVHAGVAAWTNSEWLIRLYPCSMNLGVLALFARSLTTQQSFIERLARLREPDLPAEGVIYTRHVTQIWCLFLLLNGSVALWTALYASRDIWAFYNGLLAYVLMACLFAGEWLYRHCHRQRLTLGRAQ